MVEVEISARAYVKMQLHAAKFPSRAVNGLLLAERAPDMGRGQCLVLTDCVPLFHNSLALTVMLEVALNQVDLWSAANNQVIAGYYQANDQLRDRSPNLVAMKIGDRIAEHLGGAVLIMLDNTKLSGEYSGPAVVVYERQDNKWTPKDKNLVMWQDWVVTHSVLRELMAARAYGGLVDFDDHLDDIRRDWSNTPINDKVEALADPSTRGV
ncbi:ER membrane protein complex subunit 9-like [Hypanus sabinus]|uniref:ER membrane protein complex subunit 9-like n=1 Tax=Hypanus sabinus TaxID=79690 RepID=UPI0028C3EDE6|nr:ER membrane protein complex subunit 9-like [Hypanus sabinus]XP_059807446.1 ER membrane protein complex subunit 9-like [Hypanus sabinus]XP_059807447.1 ER membrane protein complex subunit 9-like [Hypanus sabinus]